MSPSPYTIDSDCTNSKGRIPASPAKSAYGTGRKVDFISKNKSLQTYKQGLQKNAQNKSASNLNIQMQPERTRTRNNFDSNTPKSPMQQTPRNEYFSMYGTQTFKTKRSSQLDLKGKLEDKSYLFRPILKTKVSKKELQQNLNMTL